MEGNGKVLRCLKRLCLVLKKSSTTFYQKKAWKAGAIVFLVLLGSNTMNYSAAPFKIVIDYAERARVSQQRIVERQRAQKLFKIKDKDIWLLFLIEHKAIKYGVPTSIAFSLVAAESNYKIYSVNHNKNKTVDEGLFQLNNSNKDFFTKAFWKEDYEYNPFNPEHSAEIGLAYLRYLYNYFRTWEKAIAAYNCGINRVMKNATPASTRKYVQLIMKNSYIIEKGEVPTTPLY